MEIVEEANRALVKRCNEFLDIMSLPRDESQFRNAMVKASEALFKAKRFSSVLRGHARFRQSNKIGPSVPVETSILSDSLFSETDDPATSHENLTRNLVESSGLNQSCAKTSLFPETSTLREHPAKELQYIEFHAELGSSSKKLACLDLSSNGIFHHSAEAGSSSKSSVYLDLSSNSKPPLHRSRHAPTLLQLHQHLRYQQQKKQHAEMLLRSGTSPNVDSPAMSSTRSLMSSLSVDASVSNTNGSSFLFTVDPRSLSHRKRKSSGSKSNGSTVHSPLRASRCRCSLERKKFKRSVIVPAISEKAADIPPDEYSWKKYGQKSIKNTKHPRAYYKCSGSTACPAKKQVERCMDDPSKLRITYENDHDHPGPSHAYTV